MKNQVVYLYDAKRETVDELVAAHGATLLALASTNKICGRSEQAFLSIDGIILAVVTYSQAEDLGVLLPQKTPHVILAMPDDCDLAKSVCSHIDTDPGSMLLGIDASHSA